MSALQVIQVKGNSKPTETCGFTRNGEMRCLNVNAEIPDLETLFAWDLVHEFIGVYGCFTRNLVARYVRQITVYGVQYRLAGRTNGVFRERKGFLRMNTGG